MGPKGPVSSVEKTTMKASVLVDVGRLEVRDVPRPQVSAHDVLVRVAAVGICGTIKQTVSLRRG